MLVYSLLLTAVLVVGSPYWLWRMATSGRYRAGLGERLGFVPARLAAAIAGRPVVWVHAVSVGEVLAAARLIAELETARPELAVVLSTTTKTGQELAAKRLGEDRVFYFPLDFAFAVRAYLRALRPKMLVLMESELWPRLLVECGRAGVPVAVVNGRVSDRSLPRYMALRALWRPLLRRVTLLLAQDAEDARRFMEIGAVEGRVRAVGNLKYDLTAAAQTEMVRRVQRVLPEGVMLVVAGSTLQGEETELMHAWADVEEKEPKARLLVAPRHPQRFAAAASEMALAGYTVVRCSELGEREAALEPTEILLLDTIGDLSAMYSLGAAAFVGGSLVPMGGHNPLEPAQFGVPVVMGASYENFREIVRKMMEAKGICIVGDRAALEGVLTGLLIARDEALAMGERGRAVYVAESGATKRTVEYLLGLLQEAA